jgi:tRNA threonylcarbamoyladenosine biosynthesis protein TsaE
VWHNPYPVLTRMAGTLADSQATETLGAQLAATVTAGTVVYLYGDLGAGKTTLTRGWLRGLHFTGKVKSPTYTLVESYVVSNLYLYHFDLYRFNDPVEWEEAGFRDYFNAQSICLVEWPDKATPFLPRPDLSVTLTLHGAGRMYQLAAHSGQGELCLTLLMTRTPPALPQP